MLDRAEAYVFYITNVLVIDDYIFGDFLIHRRSNVLVCVCVVTVWIGAAKLQHNELDWLTPINVNPYMFTESTYHITFEG